jgi:hypothetical protein
LRRRTINQILNELSDNIGFVDYRDYNTYHINLYEKT